MVKGRIPPPLIALALGAAFSFYGFPLIVAAQDPGRIRIEAWAVIAAAAIGGMGVTFSDRSFASLIFARDARSCRAAGRAAIAFALGLVVGFVSIALLSPPPSFGLSGRSVTSISGSLFDDPRRLESGSTLVTIDLSSAEDGEGRRASASGRIVAFLPEAASAAVFAQGKGAAIAIAGSAGEGRLGPMFRGRSARIIGKPRPIERRRNLAMSAAVRRFDEVAWGGLAAALLLGKRDGLDDGEGELYARSGCAHVLSLSGMHLAVISALVALALKRPLGFRAAAVIGTLFVAVFVLFVGFQPALVRSVIMYAFGAFALLGGFPRRVLPLLASAFLVQLALDADAARGLSFVLSYLALMGIALFGPAFDDLCRGLLPRSTSMALSTSIGAFLATAAVSAAAFGSLRPIGILATLIVAPAATALMIGGLAWFALDILAPPLAAAFGNIVGLAAMVSGKTVALAADVQGPEFESYGIVFVASLVVASLLVYGRHRLNETRNRIDPFD
jgi:competence protein ComEC